MGSLLARHRPLAIEDVVWGPATSPLPLRLSWYCTDEPPPLALVTSVRAIVLRDDAVLVLRDPDGSPHLVPGGRREVGETPEETLRREVLEETGWHLGAIHPLGFIHLHNRGPKPPGYPFPYPDGAQIVCQAGATVYDPDARIFDEYVASSAVVPIAAARELALRPGQRALLEVALSRRGYRI